MARALAGWSAHEKSNKEVPFVVSRVVLQDFTGVPLLVDLAAMRDAVAALGKDPAIIEPLVPVDLVIDHSVMVDNFGGADSFAKAPARERGGARCSCRVVPLPGAWPASGCVRVGLSVAQRDARVGQLPRQGAHLRPRPRPLSALCTRVPPLHPNATP